MLHAGTGGADGSRMIPACFSPRSQKQENAVAGRVDLSIPKWATWLVVRSGRNSDSGFLEDALKTGYLVFDVVVSGKCNRAVS